MNEVLELEQTTDAGRAEPNLPSVGQNSAVAIIMSAQAKGATPEQIGQLMDLHERWERREAEKAFREAFAAFRGENIIIPKTKHVDRGRGGSFNQAEFDEVCRRLSPALSRHGFSFRHDQKFGLKRMMTDNVESDVGWVWVTCYLEHRLGHGEKIDLEGPPGDLTVNTPTQNMQVTASYLKRQSLLAITGTATSEEDDERNMRAKAGGGDDAQHEGEDAESLQAGRDASMQGMAALTEWWSKLDSKQRSRLQTEFGNLRKVAQKADHA